MSTAGDISGPSSPKVPLSDPPARKVLVAEDEHLLARSLAADLAELGYVVLGPVPNGQAAIDLARQDRPDLALLDIRMPVLDGLGATEVLYGQMGIPVVILSAYSDPPYVQASTRLGVFGYLLKPASRDELRVSLTLSWSRFQKERGLERDAQDARLKLEQRKTIEKAKGILMKTQGFGEEDAMRALQKQARDSRRPMFDLAKGLVDAQPVPLRPDDKPAKHEDPPRGV